MLKNYFKIAIRHLQRHKGYSLINILGLALGMTVSLLLLLWVQDELLFDKFHQDIENIYQISMYDESSPSVSCTRTIPLKMVPVLRDNYPEIKNAVRYRQFGNLALNYNDKDFNENNVMVTETNFFEIFDVEFIKGDAATALSDPHSIILTSSSANKIFGDEPPMEKVITINNDTPFTVTGIIKELPVQSSLNIEYILSFAVMGERADTWSWECSGFVQLFPNIDYDNFAPKIKTALVDHSPRDIDQDMLYLQPFSNVHLYSPLDAPDGLIMVYVLSGIAILILLIACINFMNLANARYALRTKEIGVRKILGAHRKHIIMQFLSESLLITFIAMLLSIGLVELLLPQFNLITAKNISLSLTNLILIIGFPLIVLFTGIFAGTYPAFFLSSYSPVQILSHKFSSDSMKSFRNILVVFQFTISIILIILSFVIYQQINYINNKNLGIKTDSVIHLPMRTEQYEKYDIIKEELLKNRNVLAVTTSTSLPSMVGNINPVTWEGKPNDDRVTFRFYNTDNDFFKLFQIPFIAGNGFTMEEAAHPEIEYVVNETAIKVMEMKDPIGKKFSMFGNDGYIVGVIKDFHNTSLSGEIRPLLISQLSWFRSHIMIRIAPNEINPTIKYIENTMAETCPGFPFSYTFLDESIARMYSDTRRTHSIILYFTCLAVFISCLGLFGLSSFMTERRAKEISIRKILGSSTNRLLFQITSSFLRWVGIAAIIAIPVAMYLANLFLKQYAYHYELTIIDFVIPIAMQALLAVVTVSYQTLRSAYTNPADILKYE
jgi:putative ABC transport system permease protein